MNRMRKITWAFVLSISLAFVVSLIAVGVAYHYVGMPKALIGFSFMGLAGLGGLAPLLVKKDDGPAGDERDQLFQRRAAIAGFATAYMVFGAACMIPFFTLGWKAMISVTWLPIIIVVGAGISHFFMYSVAILSQNGWMGKGEQS